MQIEKVAEIFVRKFTEKIAVRYILLTRVMRTSSTCFSPGMSVLTSRLAENVHLTAAECNVPAGFSSA